MEKCKLRTAQVFKKKKVRWLGGSVTWLSFSVRKWPPPPRAQGSPVGTCLHRTPERSGCPATGSPHRVNKYPSALPPSPPLVPPGPGNAHTHQFCQRNSDVMEIVCLISKTSGYSQGGGVHSWTIGCQVYRMLTENSIRSHQNIIKSPRLQWGTGHRWWRSWGRWDWATTLVGRWGYPSSATPLHTFLSVEPHPSGALQCRTELGLVPMGHKWKEEHIHNEDYSKK